MAGQSQPQERSAAHSPLHGRAYEDEPQRPDERLGGGTPAPGADPLPAADRGHPHVPSQVYEQDVPRSETTGPEPEPRAAAFRDEWGATPVPVHQPAAEPRGARPLALAILGVVVLAAVVVLLVVLLG
jgi:hypothetical protein